MLRVLAPCAALAFLLAGAGRAAPGLLVGTFWRPQFDASGQSVWPTDYEALLARCYDVLHGTRANAT